MSSSFESIVNARPYPLWWEAISRKPTRDPLTEAISVDVAIVGGGLSGLWTAYYLAKRDPGLNIAVIERDFIGYGASGRNGGWCYPGFAAESVEIERLSDTATATRWNRELIDMVHEIEKVVAEEGIEADLHNGGTIDLFRNGGQLARGEHHVAESHRLGWTSEDIRMLSLSETRERLRATNTIGGMYMAHTNAVHPAKLTVGLAAAAERHGVRIFENTEAVKLGTGRVETNRGSITARFVIRATEGYSAEIDGHHRDLVPLYSLMLATEPLSDAMWEEIGLADRETFADYRHMVIYGQRTADGRIAFGGRGAPYDFGSRIRRGAEFSPDNHQKLWSTLIELFPVLEGVKVTHRWGGVLGVARDWMPRLSFDSSTGTGWAGGYVGSGVAATNLAGRTMTDLVLGDDSQLTEYPWVNRVLRRWEPEPLRWTGITAVQAAMKGADLEEARTNRPSLVVRALSQVI